MSGNQVGRRTAEKAKIICPPPVLVKFEFDWINHFQVRVRKQKCGRTYHFGVRVRKRKMWMDRQTNGQTKGQNYTNFERNLAMMVIYVPVKLELNSS